MRAGTADQGGRALYGIYYAHGALGPSRKLAGQNIDAGWLVSTALQYLIVENNRKKYVGKHLFVITEHTLATENARSR